MLVKSLKIFHKDELLVDISNWQISSKCALLGKSGAGKSLIASALLNQSAKNLLVKCELEGAKSSKNETKNSFINKLLIALFGVNKCPRGFACIMQNPRTAFDPLFSIKAHFIESLRAHNLSLHKISPACKQANFDESLLNRYAHELSGGQLQRAMIAIAIALESELLIADEPTSDLDALVAKDILKLLKELPQDILLITHDLAAAEYVCDNICVLERGKLAESGSIEILNSPKSTALKELKAARNLLDAAIDHYEIRQINSKVILSAKDICFDYEKRRILHHLDCELHDGEKIAILGESGCGKSTLARVFARLLCARGQLNAPSVHIVFQDARASFNSALSIKQALAEAAANADFKAACELFSLHIDDFNAPLKRLSGGELARLALARAKLADAKVVIFDESTSALDTVTACEIIKAINKHFSSAIIITHDVRAAAALASTIYVLKNGQLDSSKSAIKPYINALLD